MQPVDERESVLVRYAVPDQPKERRFEERCWTVALATGLQTGLEGAERMHSVVEAFTSLAAESYRERCFPPSVDDAQSLLEGWIKTACDLFAVLKAEEAKESVLGSEAVFDELTAGFNQALQSPLPLTTANLTEHTLQLLKPAAELLDGERDIEPTSDSSSSSDASSTEALPLPAASPSLAGVSLSQFLQFQSIALPDEIDYTLPYEQLGLFTHEDPQRQGSMYRAHVWPARPGPAQVDKTDEVRRPPVKALHFALKHYWLLMSGAVPPMFTVNDLSNQLLLRIDQHQAFDEHHMAIVPELSFLQHANEYLDSLPDEAPFEYETFVHSLPPSLGLSNIKYHGVALTLMAPMIIVSSSPAELANNPNSYTTVYGPAAPPSSEQPLSGSYVGTNAPFAPMSSSSLCRPPADLDKLLNPLLVAFETGLKAILHLHGKYPTAYAPHFRHCTAILVRLLAHARHDTPTWNAALGVVAFLCSTRKDRYKSTERTELRARGEWDEIVKELRARGLAPAESGEAEKGMDEMGEEEDE
ncbi:hypothetical protein JCM10207_007792 [Rhodosporidiobolus poonsookiae]